MQSRQNAAPRRSASCRQLAKSRCLPTTARRLTCQARSSEVEPAESRPSRQRPSKPMRQGDRQAGATDHGTGQGRGGCRRSAIPDVKKDQARPSDPEKAAVPKPEPALAAAPKRSRADRGVRQQEGRQALCAAEFRAAVRRAGDDRTERPPARNPRLHGADRQGRRQSAALVGGVDARAWRAYAARQDDDERASRRRKTTGAIEVKPAPVPDSAAEALDRLTIPADAMARINEALSTGGSIIVSDQGINAGETGEGTDFIIPLALKPGSVAGLGRLETVCWSKHRCAWSNRPPDSDARAQPTAKDAFGPADVSRLATRASRRLS